MGVLIYGSDFLLSTPDHLRGAGWEGAKRGAEKRGVGEGPGHLNDVYMPTASGGYKATKKLLPSLNEMGK